MGDAPLKFAITFGRLNPKGWREAAVRADELGFESVWLPEHLVIPMEMAGSPYAGADHPPVPPHTPIYDAVGYLCYIAALTTRVRLGTYVYLLGIRHPFIAARGFATLDLVSNGRAVIGAGAGWLRSEWEAVGIDPATRGTRLDEAIEICRRLWSEPEVEFHGKAFDFDEVAFDPKPIQQPIPIYIGGESAVALERVARLGDGWIGMGHTPESAAAHIAQIDHHLARYGRSRDALEITVGGECNTSAQAQAWREAGVHRVIVSPWRKSVEAVAGMEAFAETMGLA